MDYTTADRLIKLRKKSGYSQEELAERLNISRQAISKWERAESLPDTENLIALAALYGISLDELLHGIKTEVVSNAAISNESKLRKPVMAANMKPTRHAFRIESIVHLAIGSTLLAVAILLLGISFVPESADAILALRITSGAIGFSGLVELILGIIFYSIFKRGKRHLEHLKQSGQKFEAETIKVKWAPGVRTAQLRSSRIESTYINNEGETCLVRSRVFLARRESAFYAAIYVNRQDPTDYAVEVFCGPKQLQGSGYDHDYR